MQDCQSQKQVNVRCVARPNKKNKLKSATPRFMSHAKNSTTPRGRESNTSMAHMPLRSRSPLVRSDAHAEHRPPRHPARGRRPRARSHGSTPRATGAWPSGVRLDGPGEARGCRRAGLFRRVRTRSDFVSVRWDWSGCQGPNTEVRLEPYRVCFTCATDWMTTQMSQMPWIFVPKGSVRTCEYLLRCLRSLLPVELSTS